MNCAVHASARVLSVYQACQMAPHQTVCIQYHIMMIWYVLLYSLFAGLGRAAQGDRVRADRADLLHVGHRLVRNL